jgi:hypothetical protein
MANFRLQISESENNGNHTPQIANLKTQNAITSSDSQIKPKMALIKNHKSQISKCLLLSDF